MKVAYLDCFSGISGNMILGALVDLGIDTGEMDSELVKLPLQYKLEISRVEKRGISGIHVQVLSDEEASRRSLRDIIEIIYGSTLDDDIKGKSSQVFTRLAEAEARVHGRSVDEVHFHEIGAVDTFIDVVGAVVGFKLLGVERIICSPVNVGRGRVECAHGVLPVPAPATVELLKGVPVYNTATEGELTTPTGAAILTCLSAEFGNLPEMSVKRAGYGAGTMDLEVPNLLRVLVGDMEAHYRDYITEQVTVIETNIDDMNPQFYDYIMDRLLDAGALDVSLIPAQMKKNRPGTIVSVIAKGLQAEGIVDILFRESSTLGIRITGTRRLSLPRSLHKMETKYGEIRVKAAYRGDKVVNVAPEYEDCKQAAAAHHVSISQVWEEAMNAWGRRKED